MNAVLSIRWLAVVAVVCCLFVTAAPARAEVYRNDEWGVTFTYPKGLSNCLEGQGHDHGPRISLEPLKSRFCSEVPNRRSIDMFNTYNVGFGENREDLFRSQCHEILQGRCIAIMNLQFKDFPTYAGRVDHPNGRIDVVVVTQGGSDKYSSADLINYELFLHTDQKHFTADFHILSELLATVRLMPPSN